MTLRTPGGNPASLNNWPIKWCVAGLNSEAFNLDVRRTDDEFIHDGISSGDWRADSSEP